MLNITCKHEHLIGGHMRIINLIILLMFSVILLNAQPYGLTERIPNNSFLITTTGDTLADMTLIRVFKNIPLIQPIYLWHAGDGTNRIFVVEKAGVVKVFTNDTTTSQYDIFLDISSKVNSTPSEAGLLSIAFHPQYTLNGKFYVYYNYGSLYSRIAEYKVSANPDSADPASERTLLDLYQPYSNHNGGQIAFGLDGYLYIGFGDGGSGGDPLGSGQDTTTLLGSILRIDVDNPSDNLAYGIPGDNPFAGSQGAARKEIWAWGLRNPWRFGFDRLTGSLWAGDVGQGIWEEVDLIEGGKNYGWNLMEGFHCYPASSNCDPEGLTLPIVEYNHDIGKSITGGFVYRGPRLTRLYGSYIYGDYVTRKIWALRYDDGKLSENKLIAESPSSISGFGEDETGEVYVVGYDGKIYIFNEKPDTPPIHPVPEKLSTSGLFSDIQTLTVSLGIIPYSVNAPFWSDGAYKTRYLALPDTSKIIFSSENPWMFPANAIIVKNFFLEMEKGLPESRRIIETRLLVRHAENDQWDGYSYVWNESASEATLLSGNLTRNFDIIDGDTGYTQSYYYPTREECNVCHTPAAGFALGVRTDQINRDHQYDTVWDNQLRSYNKIGLFTTDIGSDFGSFPKMTDPADNGAGLEARARSYLDANCANCHITGGSGRSNMDLRYNIPLASAHLINEAVELSEMGIQGLKRLTPGYPDSSAIYLRMQHSGEFRMPPLASSVIDTFGTGLIAHWIDSLGLALSINMTDMDLIPRLYHLYPAFPNPFNPATTIRFDLPEKANIRLNVYNMAGQLVITLAEKSFPPGHHTINFDGSHLPSGLYFYRLSTIKFTATRKMILLK